MELSKYSIGVGDRFAHQGVAQLRAIMKANQSGLEISPVWNKSNREHMYVHTHPADVRLEADTAVATLGYKGNYFVDADHINLSTVAPFTETADFFTLDVASFIGKPSSEADMEAFIDSCEKYIGELCIPGIEKPLLVTKELLKSIASKFLAATEQASEIYKYLVENKGAGNFITEVSMDEVESPQTPVDMLFILKMLADKGVPAQTIAPKFTGRFNKGVDYRGDLEQFAREFEEDVLVIDFAVKEFGLPNELKLSVHSGSDKFSIYPIMADIIKKYDKGLHLKTAGTTWLEEVIGLSVAGGEALELAKKIYANSYNRKDELCAPYADVIDIDETLLPSVEEVNSWTSEKYANTLRHIPGHPDYNSNFRQLIHVAYKVAAEMGDTYTSMLVKYSEIIGNCVEENIYERHLKRLFSL
ncbi:MAG TPA: tagaturonate epimerase family protein [Paludibacteraceae bacterium]|nr:tagaturonate epimerase family protein [Paludibacteraceae bacterium]HPT43339.1 tagaturonate epimerase family protein [Paludibacteraceae bacterium]